MHCVRLTSAAKTVSVTTETGNQQNPNQPFTTIDSATAEEVETAVTTVIVASATAMIVTTAITVTEEEKKDNPDTTVTSPSVIPIV